MSTKFTSVEKARKNSKWHVIDAQGLTLGRLATEAACLIRGKHKPYFAPHTDCGDFVVIINAGGIKLSGNKLKDKIYRHHTGFVGSVKSQAAGDVLKTNPERVVSWAIWGMLPKGTLGNNLRKKLKVYPGAEHPHTAQKPEQYKMRWARGPQSN